MWNKREEKAGYYVYPAFFGPGKGEKKNEIFVKKGLTKVRVVVLYSSAPRSGHKTETNFEKRFKKVLDKLAGLW